MKKLVTLILVSACLGTSALAAAAETTPESGPRPGGGMGSCRSDRLRALSGRRMLSVSDATGGGGRQRDRLSVAQRRKLRDLRLRSPVRQATRASASTPR